MRRACSVRECLPPLPVSTALSETVRVPRSFRYQPYDRAAGDISQSIEAMDREGMRVSPEAPSVVASVCRGCASTLSRRCRVVRAS